MKYSLIALFFSQLVSAAPEIILSPVDHLYIPSGFDSNDAVEVVVKGHFPNACYSRNNVKVTVKDDLIDIEVTGLTPDPTRKSGRFCPDVIVPFKEVVSIGNLQGGDYDIRVNSRSNRGLKDQLKVAEARSNAVDDHLYAAIDWIESKGGNSYALHGWKYSNCFELGTVKVISNKKDTLSVLPVLNQISDFCPMKGMPVTYNVNLDFASLKSKEPLLHVRTMDGKSVNQILSLEGSR